MSAVCYELTLTPNYVSNWGFEDAIRELIQNGVDQEVIDKNNIFTMEYDEDNRTLRFINTKSKLNINTLLLGKTNKDKDDETIGQFGEGYKIAALVLNRLGKTFTVYNYLKGQLWESRFKNSNKWREKILAFYISDIGKTNDGLVIEVGNVDIDEYEELSYIWLNFENQYENVEKIHTTYGDIILDEYYAGEVFINGLAINYHGSLAYGYNFKPQYIKLERDRKTCDSWDAKICTSKMILEAMLHGDIKIETIKKLVEVDYDDVYQMDIINGTENIEKALAEIFDKENPQPFSIPVQSQSDFKRVKNLGGNPVIVPHRIASILSKEKEKRIDLLKESPAQVGLTTKQKFQRWLSVYVDDVPIQAANELNDLIEELL